MPETTIVDNRSDEDLIIRYNEQEIPQAELIQILFERHFQGLYLTAHKLGLAADVTQEVIADVFTSLPKIIASYKGKSSFGSYLNTILKARVYNKSKASGRIEQAEITSEGQFESSSSTRPSNDLEQEILKLIDSLPENQKTALILRYFEEATADEIAQTLNMPVGNVYVLINRGVARLRMLLEERKVSLDILE